MEAMHIPLDEIGRFEKVADLIALAEGRSQEIASKVKTFLHNALPVAGVRA
jgi:hypothetical protein